MLDSPGKISEFVAQSPSEAVGQMDFFLLRLAELQNSAGHYIDVHPEFDRSLAAAVDQEEFEFFRVALQGQRMVDSGGASSDNVRQRIRLGPNGWARVRELRLTRSGSDRGFVAMSFDPSLVQLFERGIAPAIADAGFRADRVDVGEHNERIDDRIISSLRRARFVVADFTQDKRGVYFEAGFGIGAGLPVIWLCRDDPAEKENLHFDTNHYNHIFWTTPDELRPRLTRRIVSTVGWGPHANLS